MEMELAFILDGGLPSMCVCVDKVFCPHSPLLPSCALPLQPCFQDMGRKRRQSLQALFIPPFLQSSATNRSRSHSDTGQSQFVTINSPTTPTTPTATTTSTTVVSQARYSPELDPFSQALYSFATTDNVVSVDSSYGDLLDTDPFANLSTPPPRSPTNQEKPLPQLPSLRSALSASSIPRSPLSPAEFRARPHTATGIKYTSATTPSSPVSGPFHLPTSPARPAYTRPVFKYTPSLPSLRSLSQGHYVPTRKIRKGRVGATLPIEPWNRTGAPDAVLEESWLSSLDTAPCPSERPSPHDRTRPADDITIYSGDFNDSTENIVSPTNLPVQPEEEYNIPPSLSRQPSDQSFLSTSDDGVSSLSSFTAESESDFHSPTWSSFSRRSSGHGNGLSIFDAPSRPYSLIGVLDALDAGAGLSRSNSNSSVSLSDEDLDLLPSIDGNQSPTPPVLSTSVDFHPGTSAETIRPSPSQLLGLRLSERSSPEEGSRPSSSSFSPPDTRPVTPEPSEVSYLSTENSDEDGISCDQDSEHEDYPISDGEEDHQDTSEVETVCDHHGPVIDGPIGDNVKRDLPSATSEQPEDGDGSSGGRRGVGRYTGASSNAYGYGSLGGRSSGTYGSNGGASGSGGGRDGNGRRPSQPSLPLRGAEEDEDSDSTDDYGEDEAPTSTKLSVAPVKKRSSDEDNVPLARSIPTALKAQKSIRKQVKEESTQRRQERVLRMQSKIRNVSGPSQSAGPTTTTFQREQMSPPRAPTRTRTLPPPLTANRRSPFAVDDLTKKLMDVQASMTSPNSTRSPAHYSQEPGPSKSRRPSQDLPQSPPPAPPNPIQETSQKPALRPMRSFHRPTKAPQPDTHGPSPTFGSASVNVTPSRSIRRPTTGDPTASKPSGFSFPLRRTRSTKLQDQGRLVEEDFEPSGRSLSSRPSMEQPSESRARWDEKAAALPPVPPIPTYDSLTKPKSGEAWQQKIFLGDLKRTALVDVGPSTTAQDIVDAVESRGELGQYDPSNGGGKGWMLFELAQDFGMERPIRCFEVLADIKASWSEKAANSLLLKRTALSSRLSVEALPTASPKYQGYLEYEVKRGKWSKRWMELRDNGLWLSKRESGKDEMFLCKLTNFDVYSVTRVMKTPKPFVFSVKSTDNLSLFENTADYLHTFCCKEKEGLEWMMSVLLARSFVHYQGKRQAKPASSSLSRAGTRRGANKPPQPLLSLPPPPTVQTTPAKAVFEPGSLLASRMV